jgi:hypothetical protein
MEYSQFAKMLNYRLCGGARFLHYLRRWERSVLLRNER